MKIKILIVLLLLFGLKCFAKELNQADCVRAIVGEASGEPYLAKVAIGAVIRNRGSLKGVYGLHATHKESAKTWQICEKAWIESAKTDPTNGCKHWGSEQDRIYFENELGWKAVKKIGHTYFYR